MSDNNDGIDVSRPYTWYHQVHHVKLPHLEMPICHEQYQHQPPTHDISKRAKTEFATPCVTSTYICTLRLNIMT